MTETNSIHEGHLVVADISGYTTFLSETELEHAQAIVNELMALIRQRLVPPLRFVKLEGDCVFCYADGAVFSEGERLLEVIEVCYVDFSNRLFDMARATTCPCAACRAIDSLDLKFVVHYGTFLVQGLPGREDVAGADVILVHRLLKNSITERTGCRAYAFLTEACLRRVPRSLGLPAHAETYDVLGRITGGVHDLKQVLEDMQETKREYIGSDDADFEMSGDWDVPPAILWQYFVEPDKRLRWEFDETGIKNEPNTHGRLGVGATSHCAHKLGSDVLRRYIDWRPFNYFTVTTLPVSRSLIPVPAVTETTEFIPLENGETHVSYRLRLRDRGLIARSMFRLARPLVQLAFRRSESRLRQLVKTDAALSGPESL